MARSGCAFLSRYSIKIRQDKVVKKHYEESVMIVFQDSFLARGSAWNQSDKNEYLLIIYYYFKIFPSIPKRRRLVKSLKGLKNR